MLKFYNLVGGAIMIAGIVAICTSIVLFIKSLFKKRQSENEDQE